MESGSPLFHEITHRFFGQLWPFPGHKFFSRLETFLRRWTRLDLELWPYGMAKWGQIWRCGREFGWRNNGWSLFCHFSYESLTCVFSLTNRKSGVLHFWPLGPFWDTVKMWKLPDSKPSSPRSHSSAWQVVPGHFFSCMANFCWPHHGFRRMLTLMGIQHCWYPIWPRPAKFWLVISRPVFRERVMALNVKKCLTPVDLRTSAVLGWDLTFWKSRRMTDLLLFRSSWQPIFDKKNPGKIG